MDLRRRRGGAVERGGRRVPAHARRDGGRAYARARGRLRAYNRARLRQRLCFRKGGRGVRVCARTCAYLLRETQDECARARSPVRALARACARARACLCSRARLSVRELGEPHRIYYYKQSIYCNNKFYYYNKSRVPECARAWRAGGCPNASKLFKVSREPEVLQPLWNPCKFSSA